MGLQPINKRAREYSTGLDRTHSHSPRRTLYFSDSGALPVQRRANEIVKEMEKLLAKSNELYAEHRRLAQRFEELKLELDALQNGNSKKPPRATQS